MERRVLLAISLSFLVLFGYQALFMPAPLPETPAANTPSAGPAAPPALETPPAAPAAAAPAEASRAPAPAVIVSGDSQEREVVVETDRVRAVFTNRGARLRHWVLKQYRNDQGEPLDLVPEAIPAPHSFPFALRTTDAAITARLNDALYRPSSPSLLVTAEQTTLTFEMEDGDGLYSRKEFTFAPGSFIVSFSALVRQGTEVLNPAIEWGPGLGDDIARASAGSFLSPLYLYKGQAIYHTNDEVEREAASSLGRGVVREGQFRWAGVDDHYFISALIAPTGPIRLDYQPVTIPARSSPEVSGQYVSYAVQFPAPPANVRFYIGPKQLDIMQAIDPEFTRAIYFGMFAWLAAPLLGALRWVHGFIGSWGWSIVVLTILINLAMFPLRHKSVVSMRKMQELQPQLKAIQDRYAKYKVTDPERQKMNSEVMDMYRTRGVNPASGCVPMLLTMPFLFAFYAMLSQAIEIRGEGFLGWIPDLSRADPFFITPGLMGLTMFWQQRITPSTMDPTQQKIMMFMPIMITVTMVFAPAGLVIYWLMSNVWAIGQQYFTNWLIGPPKIHNVRPAAESRPKAVVESRTKKPHSAP
ncbi:MAG: membrane protein insertase YidC [Acidobacteriota bacterium]